MCIAPVSPLGIGGADCALVEGQIAGYAAAGDLARAKARFAERATWHQFRTALADAFALRPELKSLATDGTVVCRCEDATFGCLRQFASWREAKLQTRCGMGACQGRVCGSAAKVIFGWGMESVRPPVLPARVASLISQASTEPPLKRLAGSNGFPTSEIEPAAPQAIEAASDGVEAGAVQPPAQRPAVYAASRSGP